MDIEKVQYSNFMMESLSALLFLLFQERIP